LSCPQGANEDVNSFGRQRSAEFGQPERMFACRLLRL
jgi:hypothetical protein